MDFDFDLDDLDDLEDLGLGDLARDWDLPADPPPPQSHPDGIGNGSDNVRPQSAPAVDPPGDVPAPIASNDAAAVLQTRLDRERLGRCADCGALTHEVRTDPSGSGRSIKVPLSVPEEVHRGRCLFCHPLPTSHATRRRRTIEGHHRGLSRDRGSSPSKSRSVQRQELLLPQPQYPSCSSGVSVCTASSQQSSHSIYSQQSAPVWGGGGQPFQQQPQGHSNNDVSSDLVENYQQQRHMLQMQKQMHCQQQPQQYPDDGSVYSQASHQSHHSIHSQSYHSHTQQVLASPQLNPPNIETQFHGSPSTDLNINANNNISSNSAEIIYLQMQEASQMGNGNLDINNCLQALRQFPDHGPLQELGCTILYAQTNNNAAILSENSWGGSVSILLEAMRHHPRRPALQRVSCETLRKLCEAAPVHRQLLIQGGGVPLIIKMMTAALEDPEMQKGGCMALATIAKGGMECKICVAESGGILAVMKAVEIHPDNDLLLRAAYQALRMLGYNPGR